MLFLGISPAALPLRHLSFISRFGNSPTPERRRSGVPKVVSFLVQFGKTFWPLKVVPELVKKLLFRGVHFGILFESVGALLVPLGSLLGPSEAVSEGLGPQKHKKTIVS